MTTPLPKKKAGVGALIGFTIVSFVGGCGLTLGYEFAQYLIS